MKIDKGIPIPLTGSKLSQLLRQMKVGDSVLVTSGSPQAVRNSAARVFGAGNYASRKVEGGLRVWRTK